MMFTFLKDCLTRQNKGKHVTAMWLSTAKNIYCLALCARSLPNPWFGVLQGCKAEVSKWSQGLSFVGIDVVES